MTASSEKSLYEQLGGYEAICAASDDLIARIQSDPQLGGYWKGQGTSTKRKERQLIVDFLVEAFGGPAYYNGREMKPLHEGIGISDSDWDVFTRHVVATLDNFGVQGREREEFLAAADSLKGDIVEN